MRPTMRNWFNGALVCTAMLSSGTGEAQQARLRADVQLESASRTLLTGTVHPVAQARLDAGRMDGAQVLHGISIFFKRSDAQQADLEQLLKEQQDPTSQNYHKWLTPQQFADRFALNQQDLDKVATWLHSQALTVESISPGRDHISFGGTVAQVEAALGTEMHLYQPDGKTVFANATEVALPFPVAEITQAMRGLNNVRVQPHTLRRPVQHLTSNITGNTFVAPDDFATIFGVKALWQKGLDGAGRTVAVVGQTAVDGSSTGPVASFRKAAGFNASNLPVLVHDTTQSTDNSQASNDLDEAYLDIEWAGAVAKNATVKYVYVGGNDNSGVFEALRYAIVNNVAPVISISYGACESATYKNGITQSQAKLIQSQVQQANAQGQTIVTASGDSGASDCYNSKDTTPVTTAAVDVPSSVPEVTSIGGTSFSADLNAKSQFWNTTNNTSNGSAMAYIGETTWNDTGGGPSSSGGGQSIYFAQPSWQSALGIQSGGMRAVPDVSLPASPNHDGYLSCGPGTTNTPDCTNGFRNANTNFSVVGGTSVGAPAFASLLTLIEQSNGLPASGNINPQLYSVAQNSKTYPIAYHDITTGNNSVSAGVGFNAGTGYDMATGLGSLDGYNLEELIGALSNGKTPVTTTLQASNSSPALGQSVTFTANVASTSGNTVGAGTVQFLVDGSYTGNPVPVVNGQARFTTTFSAGGYHAVTASYFGDSSHAGANSAPLFLQQQGTGTGFSVGANPGAVVIARGSTGTSTVNVTSGGFSGSVNLTCAVAWAGSGQAGTLPTCAFNPTSVSVSNSNTIASSTLTITVPAATTGMLNRPAMGGHHRGLEWWAVGSTTMFGFVFLAGPTRRRKFTGAMLLAIAILGGCGGSKSSSTSPTTPPTTGTGVLVGNYNVTITATPSSGAAQTATVQLTVQ